MLKLLIIAALCGVLSAQYPYHGGSGIIRSNEGQAVVIKQSYEPNPDGSYAYNYETSNGIRANQQSYVKNAGSQFPAQVMQGSYSYTGPDGILYTVNYIADENGFRAEGAHLPTPPPVPRTPGGPANRGYY